MRLEHPALAAGPDRWPAGSTGAGGWRGGVVRPRHSQGAARAQPRSVGPALGAALVQALRAGRPAAADRLARRRRGTLRAACASSRGFSNTLGYAGIVVLIDRVDEPQQVEGDPRKMRALIWPLLDHKFLRHPGIGVKLLLPIELAYYLEKEDKEFYDRARPDKLNMIKPLRWTGPSLYDLASDRLRACRPDPSANGEATPAAPVHRRRDQRRLSQGRPGKPAHARGTSSSSCTG